MASSPPRIPEGFDVRAARDAQDALGPLNARGPLPHAESLHALDWLNFFLAALLMGFGPFVAVKLADRGWVPASIGLVLSASGIAGLLTQVPAGELIDITRSKRMLVGVATTAITSGVLIFGQRPEFPSVFTGGSHPGYGRKHPRARGRRYQPGVSWTGGARRKARSQSALCLDRCPYASRNHGCYRLLLSTRDLSGDRRIRNPGPFSSGQNTR
jgi:hypothetical protein